MGTTLTDDSPEINAVPSTLGDETTGTSRTCRVGRLRELHCPYPHCSHMTKMQKKNLNRHFYSRNAIST